MLKTTVHKTPDGAKYVSYDIIGKNRSYVYFFKDVSDNEEYAAMLDRIYACNCVPRKIATRFSAWFIDFITSLE